MEEEVLIPVIQAYSTTEMAPYFKRSPRQVRRELEKLKEKYGKRIGNRWNPRQVKMIFDDFGIIYKGAA